MAIGSIPLLIGLLFVLDWLMGTNIVTKAVGALVFALVLCFSRIAIAGSHSED